LKRDDWDWLDNRVLSFPPSPGCLSAGCAPPSPSMLSTASPSAACSPTTAPATVPDSSALPASNSASSTALLRWKDVPSPLGENQFQFGYPFAAAVSNSTVRGRKAGIRHPSSRNDYFCDLVPMLKGSSLFWIARYTQSQFCCKSRYRHLFILQSVDVILSQVKPCIGHFCWSSISQNRGGGAGLGL
jgi:hypothetical protein